VKVTEKQDRGPSRGPYFRRLSSGDHEFDDDASIQGLMVCVDGRNLDLVRSRRKTSDNDRPAAGFGPDPRRAINRHLEMPEAALHVTGQL
jgi:acetyl-CoA carboxylase alpha subunit